MLGNIIHGYKLIGILDEKQEIYPNKNISVTRYPINIIKVPRFNEGNGFYTTKKRSALMGKIKSKDTKQEKKLRSFIWNLGIRYRKNVKNMPGAPDILISKYKLVIFVDGEFWHGYNWNEKKQKIKSNRDFWIPKIERNMQRDETNNQYYEDNGWTVVRFWEHQLKNDFGSCINLLLNYFDKNQNMI
jgi:DNA mismatch endonuclease (patch repair protein)